MNMTVLKSIEGSTTATHNFTGTMNALEIKNDSLTTNLTFTVNGETFTVKPEEQVSGKFKDFTSVTVTTTVAYRGSVGRAN